MQKKTQEIAEMFLKLSWGSLFCIYNRGVSWWVWKRVLYNNPVTGLI